MTRSFRNARKSHLASIKCKKMLDGQNPTAALGISGLGLRHFGPRLSYPNFQTLDTRYNPV